MWKNLCVFNCWCWVKIKLSRLDKLCNVHWDSEKSEGMSSFVVMQKYGTCPLKIKRIQTQLGMCNTYLAQWMYLFHSSFEPWSRQILLLLLFFSFYHFIIYYLSCYHFIIFPPFHSHSSSNNILEVFRVKYTCVNVAT